MSREPRGASLMPQAAGRGFTLVELLVSLSVSVGVVTAAYLCLHGGLDARKLIEARMDLGQKARVALALLAADLACTCPMEGGQEFIGMQRSIGEMEADNLDFAARNWRPRNRGEGDSCEVSWFVDRSPETAEFSLWRRRDPTPDEQPLSGGIREEIVEGIAGFRAEYYDGYSWYDSWGEDSETAPGRTSAALNSYNLGGLPDAVRITLAFRAPGAPAALGGDEALPRRPDREDLSGGGFREDEEKGTKAGEIEKEAKPSGKDGSGGFLLYSTVVRLNLAPRYLMSTFGASTESSSEGSAASEKPEAGAEAEGGE